MSEPFTPEQEDRIRAIVRAMFPEIDAHMDRALSLQLSGTIVPGAAQLTKAIYPNIDARLDDELGDGSAGTVVGGRG